MENSIFKSANITVDLGNYQNIKLYSSFDIKIPNGSIMTPDQKKELETNLWIERGKDLKFALITCLKKIGKMEVNEINNDLAKATDVFVKETATIRKSCDINIKLQKCQNIKLSSGKEWTIEYGSSEERVKIEKEQWMEIANDIESSSKIFFNAIGKKSDAPDLFSETCRSKMQIATKEKEG